MERHLVTNIDKTWSGQQKTLEDKLELIRQQDEYVAIQMELQRAFGLRMKEAALLKPHMADKEAYVAVNWGTKGGRDRVVPIKNDYQRDVLKRVKLLITNSSDSMTPKNFNFKEWKNHYYYVCRQAGISRKDGITSHGLRHERLNEIYHELTQHLSPVKGGLVNVIDTDVHEAAQQEITEIAGHSRSSITNAYIGIKNP